MMMKRIFALAIISLVLDTAYVFSAAGLQTDICPVCDTHSHVQEPVDLEALKNSITPDSVTAEFYRNNTALFEAPLVYSGYISRPSVRFRLPNPVLEMRPAATKLDSLSYVGILTREQVNPSELEDGDEVLELLTGNSVDSICVSKNIPDLSLLRQGALPRWFQVAMRAEKIQRDLRYDYMLSNPFKIAFAVWDAPAPPTLPDEDYSLTAFFQSMNLPEVELEDAVIPEFAVRKRYWLHSFGAGLQFSQAYVSSNWYQGGTNYLALLLNLNWNVNLNAVFKPNLLFDSNLSYKLAVNSNPKNSMHRYSISQDQFQYNLKTGVKAFRKWFYSFTLQFKTQFFNAYPQDSETMTASFLSPADLNLGLGMTYNTTAFNENLKLSVSIAPVSYNLKVCASNRIDHTQFNIDPLRHTHSEIGSNAEANLEWKILPNLSWRSRIFIFTDYHYFQADWENTFNFAFNKFLSTQLYIYPRFDSSSDFNSSGWHYWMLKEILSVGFSYEFSTKP